MAQSTIVGALKAKERFLFPPGIRIFSPDSLCYIFKQLPCPLQTVDAKKKGRRRGESPAPSSGSIVNRNLYKYRIRARNASHRRLTLTISFAPTPAPATFFTVPRRTPCFCTLPAPPSRAAATFYFETLYILYPIRPLPSRRGSFGAFHASRLT